MKPARALLALFIAVSAPLAAAQTYPVKPVKLIMRAIFSR